MDRLRWLGICGLLSLYGVAAQAQEDGEVNENIQISPGGDVEIQFLFSKAAFRNALVLEAFDSNNNPIAINNAPTCPDGGGSVANCFIDMLGCYSGPGNCGAPPPPNDGDVDCTCRYGQTFFLGTFPDKTIFKPRLKVDKDRDGTFDQTWFSEHAQNPDNSDHLHTFKLFDNTFLLEWEDRDVEGVGDYNDLIATIRVRQPGGNLPCNNVLGYCGYGVNLQGKPPIIGPGNAPPLQFVSNAVVEDQDAEGRKIRLTTVLFNATANPIDIAVCPMLNFASAEVNGMALLEDNQSFQFCGPGGTPTSAVSSCGQLETCGTGGDNPSVRFSRDQNLQKLCPHPAPLLGDVVTVPAADLNANLAGEFAVEHEIPMKAIDDDMVHPENKLLPETATQIVNRIAATDGLYTDFLYDVMVPKIVCPNGPNTFFTASAPANVASVTYTWQHPRNHVINSPVTIEVPVTNAFLMGPRAETHEAFLELLWTDNQPGQSVMTGRIVPIGSTLSNHQPGPVIPARSTFLVGPCSSCVMDVAVSLDFPGNLPEGYQGRLQAVLIEAASPQTRRPLVVDTEFFAKDHAAPTVSSAHTERTAHDLETSATVSDLPSGIGPVKVSPTVNATGAFATYLKRVSGDFHTSTAMSGTVGSLQPRDVVALDFSAEDQNGNLAAVRLPVANTGGDQKLECTSPSGFTGQLDGSRSTGPTDVGVDYRWTGPFGTAAGASPSVSLPFGPSAVTLTLTDGRGYTGAETSTFTVQDSTPPTVAASLVPMRGGDENHGDEGKRKKGGGKAEGEGHFRVVFSCSDTCDAHPSSAADINGFKVVNGQEVKLELDDDHTEVELEHGLLKIEAPAFLLSVSCTDGSGNVGKGTARPVFPRGDDDHEHSGR